MQKLDEHVYIAAAMLVNLGIVFTFSMPVHWILRSLANISTTWYMSFRKRVSHPTIQLQDQTLAGTDVLSTAIRFRN